MKKEDLVYFIKLMTTVPKNPQSGFYCVSDCSGAERSGGLKPRKAHPRRGNALNRLLLSQIDFCGRIIFYGQKEFLFNILICIMRKMTNLDTSIDILKQLT